MSFVWNKSRQALRKPMRVARNFLVTSNLLPHNDKVRTYLRDIAPVMPCSPTR